MPKKEEIVTPFVSTHYSNFDSKCTSITANSLLSNVKDCKLKKVFDKCKVIHTLKQPKNLLRLLNRPKIANLKKVFDKCKVLPALKQPKNLLRLLNRPKVRNCISGFCPYECKDSHCNLCASYIKKMFKFHNMKRI